MRARSPDWLALACAAWLSATCALVRAYDVIPWQAAGSRAGDVVTVEGDVVQAHIEGATCVLQFSTDDPNAFRVILLIPLLTDLPHQPQRLYEGKRVRATGTVRRFGSRSEMIVRSPDAIEVVGLGSAPAAAETPPSTTPPPTTPPRGRRTPTTTTPPPTLPPPAAATPPPPAPPPVTAPTPAVQAAPPPTPAPPPPHPRRQHRHRHLLLPRRRAPRSQRRRHRLPPWQRPRPPRLRRSPRSRSRRVSSSASIPAFRLAIAGARPPLSPTHGRRSCRDACRERATSAVRRRRPSRPPSASWSGPSSRSNPRVRERAPRAHSPPSPSSVSTKMSISSFPLLPF